MRGALRPSHIGLPKRLQTQRDASLHDHERLRMRRATKGWWTVKFVLDHVEEEDVSLWSEMPEASRELVLPGTEPSVHFHAIAGEGATVLHRAGTHDRLIVVGPHGAMLLVVGHGFDGSTRKTSSLFLDRGKYLVRVVECPNVTHARRRLS
jgi:hypothetical protein